MDRRTLLALGGVALAGRALAQKKPPAKEAGHDHHAAPPGWAAVADAASECAKVAEACLTHCLSILGTGDKSMAACSLTVRDTLASSRALVSLAQAGSKHAKAMAKVCIDVCRDCEAECRKHEKTHAVCKACAEACAKMISECTKAIG